MRILIEQNGVKREIVGPFAICMGREDAENLVSCVREQLNRHCGDDPEHRFSYGWIDIVDKHRAEPTGNLPPMPWIEQKP